jgi:hypothetical protein
MMVFVPPNGQAPPGVRTAKIPLREALRDDPLLKSSFTRHVGIGRDIIPGSPGFKNRG